MKKVKIILIAITITSIAGGVFAFKINLGARRSVSMCTAAAVSGSFCPPDLACNPQYIVSKLVSGGGRVVCYTPLVPLGECNVCPFLTHIDHE